MTFLEVLNRQLNGIKKMLTTEQLRVQIPNPPLVSVIIPTYNRGSIIEKSINSVLNQTYESFELIIVDDGSTDNTEDVIYAINDKRLKYIKLEKNCGMCCARNIGTKHSKGDYIAIHDSDDLWVRNKLERHIKFMIDSKSDLSFSKMERHYLDGRCIVVPNKNPDITNNLLQNLLRGNFIPSITMFMTRNMANGLEFDNSVKRFTDWDFAIRAVKNGYKIGYIPEILAISFVQNDSSAVNEKANELLKIIYNRYHDDICENQITHSIFLLNLAKTSRNRNTMLQYIKKCNTVKKSSETIILYILCYTYLYFLIKKIYKKIRKVIK